MKYLVAASCLIGIFIASASSEAAKVDSYRKVLANRNFSIEYDVITKPVHKTNRELKVKRSRLFHPLEMEDSTGEDKIELHGIFALDGKNRYTEYEMRQGQNPCRLIKDGEIIDFFWDKRDGKKRYTGARGTFGHSKSVQAFGVETLDPYDFFEEEYQYGSETLNDALLPIIPPDQVIATADSPRYNLVSSGTLSDGTSYEDFSANIGDSFYFVRYYFDGDKMIKIATIDFTCKPDGSVIDYERSLLKINEFSKNSPSKYFSLPEGLKDKTKRNKEKSK